MERQTAAPITESQPRDVELYRGIVADIRAGQPYYEAVASELRTRGYPTRPIFNFRQPLIYVTIAHVSDDGAQAILLVLATALLCAVSIGKIYPQLTPLFMAQALIMAMASPLMYFTELWAGMCLGLSAIALTANHRKLGIGLALLALCIRELAAPFCVAATLYAAYRRDWSEVRAWVAGGVAYAAYYCWHASQAVQHILPGDLVTEHSYLYAGGIGFLLRALQWSGLAVVMPLPGFAAYIVLAAAACWAPTMPPHVRIGVVTYAAFFMVVGQPFDMYWGLMIGPLLAIWIAHAPHGFMSLLGQSRVREIRPFAPTAPRTLRGRRRDRDA